MPCQKVSEKEVPRQKVCEKVWVDGGHFLNTNKSALSIVFWANTPNTSWDILIDFFFFFFDVNGLIWQATNQICSNNSINFFFFFKKNNGLGMQLGL